MSDIHSVSETPSLSVGRNHKENYGSIVTLSMADALKDGDEKKIEDAVFEWIKTKPKWFDKDGNPDIGEVDLEDLTISREDLKLPDDVGPPELTVGILPKRLAVFKKSGNEHYETPKNTLIIGNAEEVSTTLLQVTMSFLASTTPVGGQRKTAKERAEERKKKRKAEKRRKRR